MKNKNIFFFSALLVLAVVFSSFVNKYSQASTSKKAMASSMNTLEITEICYLGNNTISVCWSCNFPASFQVYVGNFSTSQTGGFYSVGGSCATIIDPVLSLANGSYTTFDIAVIANGSQTAERQLTTDESGIGECVLYGGQ